MKKNGFTLAEVLITVAVIGVVATMTLPALMNNYQNKVYVTSLKKAYNSVSNAVNTYMGMNGITDLNNAEWYNDQTELVKFVNSYFKVINKCGTKYYDNNKCFAKTYYSLDKSSSVNLASSQCMYVVALADGMSMCFDSGSMNNTVGGSDVNGDGVIDDNDVASSSNLSLVNGSVMSVEVDINGINPPNVAGRDFFTMWVTKDGMVYDPYYDADTDTYSSGWTKTSASPMPIGRILSNGWEIKY